MGPDPDKVSSLHCSLCSPHWFSVLCGYHHAPKGALPVWHCQCSLPCHQEDSKGCSADLMSSSSMEIRGADQLESAKLHVHGIVNVSICVDVSLNSYGSGLHVPARILLGVGYGDLTPEQVSSQVGLFMHGTHGHSFQWLQALLGTVFISAGSQ